MKYKTQRKVWNKIANGWAEYKTRTEESIEEFLKDKKGKILDLGCGSGRNFVKKRKLKFYGIDFSKRMLEKAKENAIKKDIICELKKSRAHKIPYPNNFFDSAIYIATLHCIKQRRRRIKSLKELNRVLKPGAEALISVWSRRQKRIRNKPKESKIPWTLNGKKYYRYNYIYETEELLEEINSIGFKFLKIRENKNTEIVVKKLN